MESRILGRTGLRVSVLGFGCGAVGGLMVRGERGEQVRSVGRALEAGVTYFDTAPSYGDGASEQNLGHALATLRAAGQVVVGTKVRLTPSELDRPAAAIRRSLEASLERLGMDHVDVVHLHNPIGIQTSNASDPGIPAQLAATATVDALRGAVADGLAGHAGFTAIGDSGALKQLAAHPGYETAQAYLNALNPSGILPGTSGDQQDFDGFIAEADAHAKGVIAIRVYAAGALSATLDRHPVASLPPRPLIPGSEYADDVTRASRLQELANSLGMENVLELGLRFALAAPGVSCALVGLSSFAHIETAIRWAERGPLGADQLEAVASAGRHLH
jgi:L-galactose dehydrogenase/L-glyceraldehyde 3-phosphate reductase